MNTKSRYISGHILAGNKNGLLGLLCPTSKTILTKFFAYTIKDTLLLRKTW